MKKADIFSQTKKVLGNELFENLWKNFTGASSDFPDHLRDYLPELEKRFSYIPELAKLEYILSSVKPAEQTNPNFKNILNFKNNKEKLKLKSSLRLLKCRFPVWEIYNCLLKSKNIPSLIDFDLQPKVKSKYFYVIDNQENGPSVQNVSKKTFMLLERILLGHSFGEIADELFSHTGATGMTQSLEKVFSYKWVA